MIYLGKYNNKLGKIHSWSLPAITTCPGRSPLCEKICYALRYRYKNPHVKAAYRRNLRTTKRPDFAQRMLQALAQQPVRILRIHASGDFVNGRYTRAWIEICRQRPDIIFYGYTRSWNRARLLPILLELAALPNVDLWFSGDRTMPVPPRHKGIRRCYLSEHDDDQPSWKADLVFRNGFNGNHGLPRKRMGQYGSLICPFEQAIERQANITCEKCKICFKQAQTETVYEISQDSGSRGHPIPGPRLVRAGASTG